MPNDIKSILTANDNVKFATDVGTRMHARLGHVVIDVDKISGDADLIEKINSVPGLPHLFSAQSQVEVPIAGTIAHRFVSRRIDRLLVDTEQRVVCVLDYKTDTNHDLFHDAYVAQLREYGTLLAQMYVGYKIFRYILWTHDWVLESV